MSERRPLGIEYSEETGDYAVRVDGVTRMALTEDELRWLGVVLIPAALPPLPVPGLERDDRAAG